VIVTGELVLAKRPGSKEMMSGDDSSEKPIFETSTLSVPIGVLELEVEAGFVVE